MGQLTEDTITESIVVEPDGVIRVRQKRIIYDDGIALFDSIITTNLEPDKTDDSPLLSIIEQRLALASQNVSKKRPVDPKKP